MIKYFKEYKDRINDCWTLIIDIYKDKHEFELPVYPYCISDGDMSEYVFKTITLIEVKEPVEGAIVHIKAEPYHIGYCLNEKEFIHRTKKHNTRIDKLSHFKEETIGFYLVKGAKYPECGYTTKKSCR